jgi:AcrR family transcriptional regulator
MSTPPGVAAARSPSVLADMNEAVEQISENPEKRQAVLDQAIRTFAEEGFRGTDVQVVADRAGVGKGTVYRYFGNKEDLFWASTSAVFVKLRDHIMADVGGQETSFGKLRAMCLAYGSFFDAHPVYLQLFVQELAEFRGETPSAHQRHHGELIETAVRILQEGIDAGEFRPIDARKTTMSLGGVLYGTVVLGCYAKHDYTLAELIQHTVDVYLEGLRVDGTDAAGEPFSPSTSQSRARP